MSFNAHHGVSSEKGSPEDLIARELDLILSSPEFVRSARIARFLKYVVAARMEGDQERAKERSIGIEVFDRDLDWDPKTDSIVRGEARRLRTKLEQYYAVAAPKYVRISLPKGGYYPDLEFVAAPSESTSEAAISGWQAASLPGKTHSKVKLLILLGLMGCCGLAIFVTYAWSGRSSERFEIVPFANEIGPEINPSLSPDGNSIAYSWDGNKGNFDIYVKSADAGPSKRPRRITNGPDSELNPAWSPDGHRLAFLRIGAQKPSLVVKNLITGEEQAVLELNQRRTGWSGENSPFGDIGPYWAPDGGSLLYSDSTSPTVQHDNLTCAIYRVSLADGKRSILIESSIGEKFFFPRSSPDGKKIAFVRFTSHGVSDIFLAGANGSGLRRLTNMARGIAGLAWSRAGDSIYFSSWHHGTTRVWRVGASESAIPEPITDTIYASDISVGLSPGWLAYTATTENWNIWRSALEESTDDPKIGLPERLIASSGRNHGPSYSPDGSKLAFISDRSGSWQIWLADSDGGNPQQISEADGSFLGYINWTPDGRTIAFDARPTGNSNIYLLNIPQGGIPRPFRKNHFEERMPSFSRDGQSIYFNSNRDGVVAVWKTRLDSGTATKVGIQGSFKSIESPSGSKLFYNMFANVYEHINGKLEPQRLIGVNPSPDLNWFPTERFFYYTEDRGDRFAIMAYRNGSSKELRVIDGRLVRSTSNLSVSPDRRWILYAQQDQSSSDIFIRRSRK